MLRDLNLTKKGMDRLRGSTAGLRKSIGALRNNLLLVSFTFGALIKGSQALIAVYKKQIEAIDGAHKEEIAKRNAIIEEYTKIIEAIEKEYDLEKKALETKKKKEVKKLVEENIEDPKALAEMISEEFGFNYTGTE